MFLKINLLISQPKQFVVGFFSTADCLHYQCLRQVHRTASFQQLTVTLSMSWTSSQNCFFSTADCYIINVLDKFKELFLLYSFLALSMSWTISRIVSSLQLILLHYQGLRQVQRIVSSSTAVPYSINVLDKFIELFSLISFLTLKFQCLRLD